MKNNEVKCYGITISTDETFNMIMQDDIRLNAITNTKPAGVYLDPNGFYQMLIYRTPEKRNKAFKVISRYFKTAAVCVQPIYVEKEYLGGKTDDE